MLPNVVFQDYVVGLIDVLNQGQQLEALDVIPENDEQKAAFIQAAKKTVGVVNRVREAFRQYVDEAIKEHSSAKRALLNEHQREEYDRLVAVRIGCQNFGDTTVLYSPLVNQKGALTLGGICRMLIGAGGTLLCALADGVALRGGIDVGGGAECWPNEIYGPVLRHAYHIESTIAEYPRIVVSKEAIKYVQDRGRNDGVDLLSAVNRDVAALCMKLVCTDRDGTPIVDYLGPGFREIIQKLDNGVMIEKAYRFVETEYQRFVKEEDRKLALRYARLLEYFRGRAGMTK